MQWSFIIHMLILYNCHIWNVCFRMWFHWYLSKQMHVISPMIIWGNLGILKYNDQVSQMKKSVEAQCPEGHIFHLHKQNSFLCMILSRDDKRPTELKTGPSKKQRVVELINKISKSPYCFKEENWFTSYKLCPLNKWRGQKY